MKIFFVIILFILMLWANGYSSNDDYSIAPQNPKIAPFFEDILFQNDDKSPQKIWVFFTDKQIYDDEGFDKAAKNIESLLSASAITRRQIRCNNGYEPDILDIPISQIYIKNLEELGFEPEYKSRWLNAISGFANTETIQNIIELPYVVEIRPVAKYRREVESSSPIGNEKDLPEPGTLDPINYGPSFKQFDMLNIPLMHQLNYDGTDVTIAVLDGGFRYTGNPVFNDLIILDTFDFVNNIDDVQGYDNGITHGSQVLSLLGGFADGHLIGAAYDANYLLYETEDSTNEYVGEEDFWIAAAERADAAGADIITASLGYPDWYTYSDLNGLTAPITVAADIAFSRGILVVNSAGNERACGNPDDCFFYITPPADGFNVLAVGAVDSFGVITSISSSGPSYDRRVKPDIAAMGLSVYCANFNGTFLRNSGTSFAAPLIAGGLAQIIDYNANVTVEEIRSNLIQSGDRFENPDTLYGYGLPDIFRAAGLFRIAPIPDMAAPVGQYTIIPLEISTLTPISDPIIENFPDSAYVKKSPEGQWQIIIYGFPEDIGSYSARVIINETIADIQRADTAEFNLRVVERANIAFGPNPFTDSLSIFVAPEAGAIEDISIFSTSGDKVWDSFSDNYNSMTRTVVWDGTNNRGGKVAPGVYLVLVRAQWSKDQFKVFKK